MTWIQTCKGRAFDLVDPSATLVDFDEIAFALARLNRFTGHAGAYSVAQHCAHGCDYLIERCEFEAALYFLLHDAHEAFVGDISSPMIAALSAVDGFGSVFRAIKKHIDAAIYDAAGIDWPSCVVAQRVRDVDLAMLRTERQQLMAQPPKPWVEAVERAELLPIAIDRLAAPEIAERRWLTRFHQLSRRPS